MSNLLQQLADLTYMLWLQAQETQEGLSKAAYSRTFDAVVERLNKAVAPGKLSLRVEIAHRSFLSTPT
jgi:myosin heavy subunit